MGPAGRRRLGRDDRAQGDGAGGGPPRSGAGARRGGQRAGGARAVRLADEPGRRRADPAHRAGIHPAGRHGLPAPRAHIRGAARRRDDTARSDRRGVRAEPPGLCQAMRLPRPAAGPHLGRRSPGIHRHLGAGDRHGHAVGRRLARAHVRVRDPPGRRRHRGDADRARDRHLRRGRRAAERAVERGDRARGRHLRAAHLPPTPGRKRWRGPSCSRRSPPPTTS